jgi:hypothetical protein
MRPFGHTEAKRERIAHVEAVDDDLRMAFKEYARDHQYTFELKFKDALKLLRPLSPSLRSLHRFALSEFDSLASVNDRYGNDYDIVGAHLGIFLSAGYQSLAEECIVYDLHLPHLDCLGAFLSGKRLVITGTTGNETGHDMLGTLVNEGVVGEDAAYAMIGRFENRGRCNGSVGINMFGALTSVERDTVASSFIGRANDVWQRVNPEACEQFLRDVENPDGLSYDELRVSLYQRYRR